MILDTGRKINEHQSAIDAEYSNQIKDTWTGQLNNAVNIKDSDAAIEAVKKVIQQMRDFYFTE